MSGVRKVISGGQTGVDRAALDAALDLGLEIGGWCPAGRRADDGRVPDLYPLTETRERDYRFRTRANVMWGDATLLIRRGSMTPGSKHTAWVCLAEDKKLIEVELEDLNVLALDYVRDRLRGVHVLNVAGPREVTRPGIYQQAREFVTAVLRQEAK